MRISLICGLLLCSAPSLLAQEKSEEAPAVNFTDHVLPIFRQHCLKCHNANDAEAGLAIDTYAGVLEGGGSGEAVSDGDANSSRLYLVMTHAEEPTMPPNQDPIPKEQLEIIRQWIDGGLLENSGSKRKKKKGPSLSFSSTDSSGKPEQIAMPESVWRVPVVTTQRHAAASAIVTSPWAPLVAVAGQRQVSLYHTETAELLGVIPYPEGIPQALQFSRDGAYLLVAGGTHAAMGTASLYDVRTGRRLLSVGDELDVVFGADINDDLSKIAMGGPQRIVRIFDTSSGDVLYELKKHTDWVYSVAYSPDGVLVASGDRSGGLHVWEAETGRLYLDLTGHTAAVRGISWRADSNVLVSASEDGTVKLWEMNSGNQLKSINAHGGGATGVMMARDGRMVTCGKDRTVKLWDAAGNNVATMPAFAEPALEAAITFDGKKIIGGDWAGQTVMWTVEDPKQAVQLAADPPSLEQQKAALTARVAELNSTLATAVENQSRAQQVVDSMTVAGQALATKLNETKAAMAKSQGDLATAEKSLADWKANREATQKRLAEASAAVANLSKQIQDNAAFMSAQKQALDQAVAKRDEAMTQQAKLAAELVSLRKQHDALKSEALASLTAVAARELDLAAQEKVAAGEESGAEAKRDQAEKQVTQFSQQLSDLEAKLKQSNGEIAAAKNELQSLIAALDSLPGQIQAAKQQLDALSAEVDALEKRVSQEADETEKQSLAAQLEQARTRLIAAQKTHADVSKQLAEANAKKAVTEASIRTLTAQIDAFGKQQPQLVAQREASQKELQQWLAVRNEAMKKHAALKQQLAQVSGEAQAMTKLKSEAVEKIAEIVKRQELTQRQHDQFANAASQQEATRSAAAAKLTELQQLVDSLKPKLEDAQANEKSTKDALADLDAKLKAQPELIAKFKQSIASQTTATATLEKQVADNKEQVAQANAKLVEAKATAEAARTSLTAAQQKVADIQAEIDSFTEFGKKLVAEAASSEAAAAEKRSAVEPEATRATSLATAMSKREQELSQLAETLAKLQSQLDELKKAQAADQQTMASTQAKVQDLEAAAEQAEAAAQEKREEAAFFQAAYGE